MDYVGSVPTYVPATGTEAWVRHAGAGTGGRKAGLQNKREQHQTIVPRDAYP